MDRVYHWIKKDGQCLAVLTVDIARQKASLAVERHFRLFHKCEALYDLDDCGYSPFICEFLGATHWFLIERETDRHIRLLDQLRVFGVKAFLQSVAGRDSNQSDDWQNVKKFLDRLFKITGVEIFSKPEEPVVGGRVYLKYQRGCFEVRGTCVEIDNTRELPYTICLDIQTIISACRGDFFVLSNL